MKREDFMLVAAAVEDWANGYDKSQVERKSMALELSSRFMAIYPAVFNLAEFNERCGIT